MAIKMRENKNKECRCIECKTKWINTPVMYDIMIHGNIYNLCKDCSDLLFKKLLTASCNYNHKIKSKEDIKRKNRNDSLKNKGKYEHISINEEGNKDE